MNLLLVIDFQKEYINDVTSKSIEELKDLVNSNKYDDILFTRFINSEDNPVYKVAKWYGCMDEESISIPIDTRNYKVLDKGTYTAYNEELIKYIKDNNIPCPKCGKCDFTDIRQFKLMFETYRGVTKDSKSVVYLRPENAQGEYVNFLNVQRSMRAKLPFSIGQIGKAFRNEITPGNFTFRTIEFEQMEYQTFCKEGMDQELYEYFKDYGKKFFMSLGLPEEKLRFHDHEKLAHYAKAACDIEYLFPFGWGEINGTHNRTNFDLTRHEEYSGIAQRYLDPDTNEKYIPYIIESTYGLDRTVLAILFESLHQETLENGEVRDVLKLSPYLAPYKVTVLPLIKKNHSAKALEIYHELSKHFMTSYDEAGNIGKRYRRSDAIGTPFCITIDDETLNNNTVTLRNRDTMQQITLDVSEIVAYVNKEIEF